MWLPILDASEKLFACFCSTAFNGGWWIPNIIWCNTMFHCTFCYWYSIMIIYWVIIKLLYMIHSHIVWYDIIRQNTGHLSLLICCWLLKMFKIFFLHSYFIFIFSSCQRSLKIAYWGIIVLYCDCLKLHYLHFVYQNKYS